MKLFWSLIVCVSTLFSGELSFTSIQSDFTQKVTSPEGSILEYQGTFYARDDNRALWVYTKPITKKIYFLPGRVMIVEPDLEQVIISALDKTPNLSKLLSEAKKTSDNAYEAHFGETTYHITTKEGVPESIYYLDKLENKVQIILKEVTTNLILDNVLFTMQIPSHYDVINQ